MYFSVYGVSLFKYSFNFSRKSEIFFIRHFLHRNDLCEGFIPSYIFRSAFLNTSSLHFSRATEGYWNGSVGPEVNVSLAVVQCICARFLPVCPVAIE